MSDTTVVTPPASEPPAAPPADPPASPPAETSRPDYIPEKFWDADTKMPRVESLAKSYSDLETHSRRKFDEMNEDDRAALYNTLGFDPGAVMESDFRQKWEDDRIADRPAKAEDYKFDAKEAGIPDIVEFDDTADDPMLNWWRGFSHDQGFSNDVFGQGVSMWLNSLASMQPDVETERKALGDNPDVRIDQANSFLNQAGLADNEMEAIKSLVTTAAGVTALEKLARLALPPNSQNREGDVTAHKLTEEELRALQGTKEYLRNDPATVRKVQEGYAALYPEGI